jgi:hypothetical protein
VVYICLTVLFILVLDCIIGLTGSGFIQFVEHGRIDKLQLYLILTIFLAVFFGIYVYHTLLMMGVIKLNI